MAEPRKIEQIIVEFFAKILHIILESRIPSACSSSGSSSSSASPPCSLTVRDKWFNLALGEFAYVDTEPWRRSPTSEPMVVDVILLPSNSRPRAPSSRVGVLLGFRSVVEVVAPTVLERWTVHYAQSSSSSAPPNADVEAPAVYKKAVIMLRSVYCTARLLPAYRLSRWLGSTCQSQSAFRLVYRVSAWPEPLPRGEMVSWSAAPVETPCGKLCVSVSYVPTIASASAAKEVETSCTTTASLVPQIIPDYVGSPAAEQVLRRFQGDSSPVATKGAHGVSSAPNSPACTGRAIGRCHSWSGGINKGIHPSPQSPSRCLSLSPLSSNPNSRMPPLPAPPQRCLRIDHSLSPSPSPPTRRRLPQDNVSRALSRTESAPVSAPSALAGGSTSALAGSSLPPHSRTRKPGALPWVASANSGLMSAYYMSSQGSPPFRGKCVVSMPSEFQIALQAYSNQKVCKDWKDDGGSPSGVKISSGSSPRITFSRSSSKRSINYEIEDEEFSCPFAIDDDELDNFRSRIESIDGKGRVSEILETSDQAVTMSRRSPDAAVGILVQMLKSAPPLCQDLGNSSDSSLTNGEISRAEHVVGGICISGFPSSMQSSVRCGWKTAADALKELKNYREIKEGLLRQSGTQAVQRRDKSSRTLQHEISGGLWSQGV